MELCSRHVGEAGWYAMFHRRTALKDSCFAPGYVLYVGAKGAGLHAQVTHTNARPHCSRRFSAGVHWCTSTVVTHFNSTCCAQGMLCPLNHRQQAPRARCCVPRATRRFGTKSWQLHRFPSALHRFNYTTAISAAQRRAGVRSHQGRGIASAQTTTSKQPILSLLRSIARPDNVPE